MQVPSMLQGESLKRLEVVAALAPVRADKFRALSDAVRRKSRFRRSNRGSAGRNFPRSS
jgi:hypothetical protein